MIFLDMGNTPMLFFSGCVKVHSVQLKIVLHSFEFFNDTGKDRISMEINYVAHCCIGAGD